MWGWLKALPWVGRIVGLGAWTNPVFGAVVGFAQMVWGAIMYVIRGILSFLQNPMEVAAVAVLLLAAFVWGINLGRAWDRHLVEKAQTQLRNVHALMEVEDEADARRAEAAVKARREAEALERARIAEEAARDPLRENRADIAGKAVPLTLIPLAAPAATPVADVAPEPVRVRAVSAAPRKVRRRVKEPGMLESFQANIDQFFGITPAKN